MISRAPKSSAYIERRMMEYARSAEGLTWRRVHDTFSRDDRIRARDVFDRLTRSRGPLHARTHKRATWYFASSAQASAWTPPMFNAAPPKRHTTVNGALGLNKQRDETRAKPIYTICPAPKWDSRYQIDPAMRVVGGFATLGMGRYIDD